jgi:hypothetical protein
MEDEKLQHRKPTRSISDKNLSHHPSHPQLKA